MTEVPFVIGLLFIIMLFVGLIVVLIKLDTNKEITLEEYLLDDQGTTA